MERARFNGRVVIKNRFTKVMREDRKIKESVKFPRNLTKDSIPKAQSGKGKTFEELLAALEPKLAKLLKALLGEKTKVVSLGPGENWVLDSPKYDKLVSVVVYGPSRLKVQYLSPGTANMLVVEGNKAFVRPTTLFEKRLSEEYEEFKVDSILDSEATELPSLKARIVAALNRFNFKIKGNRIDVGKMLKGPVGEFLKKALFEGETPYANRVFVGHLPGGTSIILAYKDRENTALFHELFIESDSGRVKHRLLESLTKKKLEVIAQAVQGTGFFEELGNTGE